MTRDKRKNRELESGEGGVKNRQIEQWQAGHSLDLDKNNLSVCPGCIADDGLRGLSLGELFDYMGDRISTEWDRAEDTLFYGDGDEVWESGGATVYDAYDLLGELDDPLGNDELRDAFVAAFEDDRISLHAFRLAHHERLAYG